MVYYCSPFFPFTKRLSIVLFGRVLIPLLGCCLGFAPRLKSFAYATSLQFAQFSRYPDSLSLHLYANPQKKAIPRNGYQTWGGGMKNISFSYLNKLNYDIEKYKI